MQLNDKQREAVTSPAKNIIVLAGPGSGKTRVLTHRIAHLIEQGVPPHAILAVTFTNRAAGEMKERLAQMLPPHASAKFTARTFHSFGVRVLRRKASTLLPILTKTGVLATMLDRDNLPLERATLSSNFSIYDEGDKKSLLNAIIKDLDLDAKRFKAGLAAAAISKTRHWQKDR